MSLKEYERKRDFNKSPEPAGARRTRKKTALTYIIQKHAASHLHYDFRLEIAGVLKSWAVPKGPSLNPKQKRLAMQVEDHPLEYATFEGVIPAGEYGGGTVMLWDNGTWEPLGNPQIDYHAGKLEFILHGEKLKGKWVLVRLKKVKSGKIPWLLIKATDTESNIVDDILTTKPLSVSTGHNLEAIAANKSIEKKIIKSKKITFTHKNKILFEDKNITKGQLADYYDQISEWILPHIINRPLMLLRCPSGQQKACFYQKHHTDNLSKHIYSLEIQEKHDKNSIIYIKNKAGLLALAQLATIEIHQWGCHIKDIEKPDQLVFDLDPGPTITWSLIAKAAQRLREYLSTYKLTAFVKTSGKKGLHVIVPIKSTLTWEQLKIFASNIATQMATDYPKEYVATMSKARRFHKVFIDYFRNSRGATTVAPYSCRATANANVSLPISWQALTKLSSADSFDIISTLKKIKQLQTNPWQDFFKIKQKINFK